MPENLPERVDTSPALFEGQAALFEDPRKLLTWEEGALRTVAANLGRQGGSILAQMRRMAGLVAWAAWYRFPEATYREFATGLASSLGIEVETLRKWRRAVVKAEDLPVPGVADQRADAAAKGRKTAGQPGGAVRTSASSTPIPAASAEAPTRPSGGGEPPASQPPVVAGPPARTPAGPSPDAHPTERPPTYRVLAARVIAAMQDVEPSDAGPALTPEEATFLRQWAQGTLDAWRVVYAPAKAPEAKPGNGRERPARITPTAARIGGRRPHAEDCHCLGCDPKKATKA